MEKRKVVVIGNNEYSITCSQGSAGTFRVDVCGPSYDKSYGGYSFNLESMLIAAEKDLQAHFNREINVESIFERLGLK